MKAEAPHAARRQFRGQRENLIEARLRRMKRSVEASPLWNIWRAARYQINCGQACRLMKGREPLKLRKRLDRFRGQERWPREVSAAVNNAMSHSDQLRSIQAGEGRIKRMFDSRAQVGHERAARAT
jgi:hypothetical protein